MTDESEGGWILIGRTAGAFGLRGDLKVEPLTDFPERFSTLDTMYLGPDHVPWPVERTRPHGKHVLVKLAGVETVEAAAALRGRDAFVPRSAALPLPEGHYFLADLVGISVFAAGGAQVGIIVDVLRTGSNDVYVVRGSGREILIPGIRDAVAELDLSSKRMVVQPWVLESPA